MAFMNVFLVQPDSGLWFRMPFVIRQIQGRKGIVGKSV